jgi:hypothetical protein
MITHNLEKAKFSGGYRLCQTWPYYGAARVLQVLSSPLGVSFRLVNVAPPKGGTQNTRAALTTVCASLRHP